MTAYQSVLLQALMVHEMLFVYNSFRFLQLHVPNVAEGSTKQLIEDIAVNKRKVLLQMPQTAGERLFRTASLITNTLLYFVHVQIPAASEALDANPPLYMSVKCVCPVAQSATVELVVSDDRSLIVHSHRRILLGESVG